MTGNLHQEQATGIARKVESFVKDNSKPLHKSQIPSIRPIFLPLGKVSAV